MKKILLFFIFLNVSLTVAQMQIEMPRDTYMQGETVQTKLNFSYRPENEITLNEIGVYTIQGAKVPIAIYFLKLTDTYYYTYFTLPYIRPGNYTLNVGKYFYIKDGLYLEGSSSKTFTVSEGKGNVISVDPGFVKLSKDRDYFSINIKNNGNIKVNISAAAPLGLISDSVFLLNPGYGKVVNFSSFTENSFVNISYGNASYSIPVWVSLTEEGGITNATITNLTAVPIPRDAIGLVEPVNFINLTLGRNDSVEGALRFRNFFTKNIDNLNFVLSNELRDVVRLSVTYVNSIQPGETIIQYLWVNSDKNLRKSYKGKLILESKDTSVEVPVSINYEEMAVSKTTKLMENVTVREVSNATLIPEKKKNRVWAFVIIFLLIAIIAATILFLFRKRPKQESFEDFISSLKH